MRIKISGLLVLLATVTTTAVAGERTGNFEVKGNCGMCEKTIEKAALSVDGVGNADWNKESKLLKVTFDDTKTSEDKIQSAIAKSGYDTKNYKAKDEVYNKLPACCKYDRNAEPAEDQVK
ncbi:MAG TPA: cation transporter [Mariniphaga sp.]|nr:cation transporter [Mariniphaga sp.]